MYMTPNGRIVLSMDERVAVNNALVQEMKDNKLAIRQQTLRRIFDAEDSVIRSINTRAKFGFAPEPPEPTPKRNWVWLQELESGTPDPVLRKEARAALDNIMTAFNKQHPAIA